MEKQKGLSFWKILMIIAVLAAVVVYCTPELKEKAVMLIENLKEEWRKRK